ncbi:winged helix-turn-helix transcriptional regulator [Sphingobacterium sp. Mn56C]|uniref:winged helix-turn-helix transcriptional regulator n=1 Tax=Sphingobacterium sp. Mn56C TaxID=3395261 RepID=UPI003BC2BE38
MISENDCSKAMLPIKDALDAVEGRWKLLIIYSLCAGSKRFTELVRDVEGITDKTLSKELKVLLANKMLQRTVYRSTPPRVEYSLTEHGRSINKVLFELWNWGRAHRKIVLGDRDSSIAADGGE